MRQHNKLVRDKIPNVLDRQGVKYKTHLLNSKQRAEELNKKLVEEAKEFAEAPSLEERADIEEVLRAIDKEHNFNPVTIEKARSNKHRQRGGFDKGIFLETTD